MAKKKPAEKKMLFGRQIDSNMSRYDFDGSIDKIISMLLVIKKENEANDWTNIRITWESDWDNNYYYNILGDRLENDVEFNNRIRAEEKAKADKKEEAKKLAEKELKEYERLKAKFEKGNK